MRVAIIQPPYPKKAENSRASFDFILSELAKIKRADLILIPEYSNAPGPQTRESLLSYGAENYAALLKAVQAKAKELSCLAAFNAGYDEGEGLRNTTYLVNENGEVIHRYFKLHLPALERDVLKLDYSYAAAPEPCVFEYNGIRYGFMTCYDSYFNEQIEYFADKAPDVIILLSYQRSENSELLAAQVRLISLRTGAAVFRCSWSMGADSKCGGTSMATDREANTVAFFGQNIGTLYAETDVTEVPYRSNGFGMPKVENRLFISNGRNPLAFNK